MIPVPDLVVAWLTAGDHIPRDPRPTVAAVVCNPDRLVLWLTDGAGCRRAVDCLPSRPWLTALLLLLAPLFRLEARAGRLLWGPHPAGVLFALDAFLSLTGRRKPRRNDGARPEVLLTSAVAPSARG